MTGGVWKKALTASATAVAGALCTEVDALHHHDCIVTMTMADGGRQGPPIEIDWVRRKEMHHAKVMRTRAASVQRGNERQPPVAKKQAAGDDGEHAPMRIASRTLAMESRTNSARSYTLVM